MKTVVPVYSEVAKRSIPIIDQQDKYWVYFDVVIDNITDALYRSSRFVTSKLIDGISRELALFLKTIDYVIVRCNMYTVKRVNQIKLSDFHNERGFSTFSFPDAPVIDEKLKDDNSYLIRYLLLLSNVNDSEHLHEIIKRLNRDIETLNRLKTDFGFQILSYDIMRLKYTENLGLCEDCNAWVSDHTQEKYVHASENGAKVNGKWFCEYSLPPDHPSYVNIREIIASMQRSTGKMNFRIAHTNINVKDTDASVAFYGKALGLKEQRRHKAGDGSFQIVFLGDGQSEHQIELTWLRDKEGPYNLGDNESHICFVTDGFEAAHALHEQMGCICFENTSMGLYFIEDPDGYWLEIVPKR